MYTLGRQIGYSSNCVSTGTSATYIENRHYYSCTVITIPPITWDLWAVNWETITTNWENEVYN
jgi:hypothetical protein